MASSSDATYDATQHDLQLTDLIHTSPTPPQREHPRSVSPEHLTEADVAHMRHRAAEIGLKSRDSGNITETERELLAMVRRLTESALLDPSQLVHQAEIISGLLSQRDFLVRQAEEERERWASQRDGWERMAEALIAQRNKTTNLGSKDPELERYCAAYESDNRALREKLSDTQTRLQCLEAEITKLRPILLMQPVPANSSASGAPYPSIQAASEKAKPGKKKKKKKEHRVPVYSVTIPEEPEVGGDQTEPQPMDGVEASSFFQFQARPLQTPPAQPSFTGDHYRKPTSASLGGPLTAPPTTLEFQVSTPVPAAQRARTIRHPSPPPPDDPEPGPSTSTAHVRSRTKPSSRRPQGAPLTPLTSDARTEHILLAARKIGRERAGIVAGYVRDRNRKADVQRIERDKERSAANLRKLEREKADRISYYRNVGESGGSPETPKRGSTGHYPNVDNNMSPRAGGGSFVTAEARGDGVGNGNPNTPRQNGSVASGSQQAQTQGPGTPTPLSSLLDAARMMNDDDQNGATTSPGRRSGVNGSSRNDSAGTVAGRRRGVAAVEQAENPAPKRRRIASARASASAKSNGSGGGKEEGRALALGRVKSALDVLADQAAAFSSKGKARERDQDRYHDEHEDEGEGELDDNYMPVPPPPAKKGRGRTKAPVKDTAEKATRAKLKPAIARKPRASKANAVDVLPSPPTARLISPPGPRALESLTSAAGRSRNGSLNGISPLDAIPPPSRRSSNAAAHLAPASPAEGEDTAARGNARFGFRPAAWSDSSSPVRPVAVKEGRQLPENEERGQGNKTPVLEPPSQESRDIGKVGGLEAEPGFSSKPGPTPQDIEMGQPDQPKLDSDKAAEFQSDPQDVDMDLDTTQSTSQTQTQPDILTQSTFQPQVIEEPSRQSIPPAPKQPQPPQSPIPSHLSHIDSAHPPPEPIAENAGVDADAVTETDAEAEADVEEGDADADGEVDADAEGELELDSAVIMDVVQTISTTTVAQPLPPGMPYEHDTANYGSPGLGPDIV